MQRPSQGVAVLRGRVQAFLLLCLAGWVFPTSTLCCADDHSLLQQAHVWGRFSKGAWREVVVVTEGFDDSGHLTSSSTTESKITLEEVTPEQVTLRIENTVELAGRRFPSPPQVFKQGYAGENVGQTVSIKPLEPATLVVAGRAIPCETQQIEILGGVSKQVSLISYANDPKALVLKRKTTTSDVASAKTTLETVSEVLALDMGVRVLDESVLRNGYFMQQVQKNDLGVTTTLSWHVPDIPGEVVHHSSKKVDNQGRLVRRSTLELVGYGDGDREPAARRARRHPKRAR